MAVNDEKHEHDFGCIFNCEQTDQEVARRKLRDQFAMAALGGLLANPTAADDPLACSIWAYKYADAMLAARDAKP